MSYRKITLSQVKALARKKGSVTVELFPSNCGPSNQNWVKGCEAVIYSNPAGDYFYILAYFPNRGECSLDSFINEYAYYNCNNEIGNRVHYYLQEVAN